jgi:glycosyl-4,4'-diaponeurosporenoate acyltransferase
MTTTEKVVLVLVNIVAWGVIHASTGYLVHRLPARLFTGDSWLTRQRRLEGDGRLYVRVFRIKRWKHLLPEAGALFAGGFDKRRLTSRDDDYLATYVRETRRAELGHWLAAAGAPLFFLWNPAWIGAVMVVYAVVANGPCVLSQRYNRLRLVRIAGRRTLGSSLPRPSSDD